MAIAWIQNLYNDTDLTFWFRSFDSMHNGVVGGTNLDDHQWHDFAGHHQYAAQYCAIPWLNRGDTYKDLSSHPDTHILRFWSDPPTIYFADGNSGQLVGEIVLSGFADWNDADIDLSLTPGGIYFNILTAGFDPIVRYVVSPDGQSTEVDSGGLANVLGNVAGGTIVLTQGRKKHHAAKADEETVAAE